MDLAGASILVLSVSSSLLTAKFCDSESNNEDIVSLLAVVNLWLSN